MGSAVRKSRLGRSGLLASVIALGTWEFGGYWGDFDEKEAIGVIRHALELGVNLFDTAQGYGFGLAEALLAKSLAGVPRDTYLLATKGGIRLDETGMARDSSARWIEQGIHESLRALQTDYIDLYQIHWPDRDVPFQETAEVLQRMLGQGIIRHVGVSNFTVPEMEDFSRDLQIDTIQPPYHMLRREIEQTVLPYAAARDIGVLIYSPLGHGLLSGHLTEDFAPEDWRSRSNLFRGDDYRQNLRVVGRLTQVATDLGLTMAQLAIAWTLANPAVQVTIIGTGSGRHVADAVRAADVEFEPDVLARISAILSEARPAGGLSPETS
jgi:aryl-alcohol dehydrogenase-like predicted oxidoreductase